MSDNNTNEWFERKAIANHLFDDHGILLTRHDFRNMEKEELQGLDPCCANQ